MALSETIFRRRLFHVTKANEKERNEPRQKKTVPPANFQRNE